MATTIEAPTVGSTMPDIRVQTADGTDTTLRSLVAGRRAVLFFMRASTCPVCRAHAAEAVRLLREGALGSAVLVVVTPGLAAEAAAVARRVVGDGVIVAGSGSGHAEVGLGRFLGLQHSGTFVLDERGTVLVARTATIPTGAFNAAEVVAALAG